MNNKGQSNLPPQSADGESRSLEKAAGEPGEQVPTPETPQIDSTPEGQRIATPGELEIVSISESSSGPLPPPHMLKGYEEALPGGADRIFKMAESQNSHRQEQESRMLTAAIQRSKSGMFLGFSLVLVLALAFLGAAVWLIIIGEWYSILLGAFEMIVTLAGSFVLGRRSISGTKNPHSPANGDVAPAT